MKLKKTWRREKSDKKKQQIIKRKSVKKQEIENKKHGIEKDKKSYKRTKSVKKQEIITNIYRLLMNLKKERKNP